MFKDADGKLCMAKLSFFLCLLTFLSVILSYHFGGADAKPLDYTGMAAFLAVAGGAYLGRNYQKDLLKKGSS